MRVQLDAHPFSLMSEAKDGKKAFLLDLRVLVELPDTTDTVEWPRVEAGYEALKAAIVKTLDAGLVKRICEFEETVQERRVF